MTVEQNAIQQHCQKHQQTVLNQLSEISGTTDVHLLQQALRLCNGDLAGAVAFLAERSAKVLGQDRSPCCRTSQAGSEGCVSECGQTDASLVDGARGDKGDLQRAIALSLEDSSRDARVADEEQAINRVLEVCMVENKARLPWTRAEVWHDPPNPHERKRQGSCPVGLKNVGNTCWFSAVIQSLFHLLEFQKLVLHYSPAQRAQDLPYNQKALRNLLFMQELRRLFSLMVASKRKYVDPTRAVAILKEAFQSSESQQDVSEFTHKLLDWLEDAFQVNAEEDREGEQPKNPMVELFYGRFSAVGVLEGKRFENTEMFGQYPLRVNGFKNLHECLEAAMIEGEIESLHSENCAKSGQEHWFTELPPVLTLELSRFEFNQALGRPEKIHNRLEFPSVLYVDRYMDKNKEVTRMKREEIRRLKENLTTLQQRLERYLSYGSGPKRWPLAEVLEYAMEFASSRPISKSSLQNINDSSVPPGSTSTQSPSRVAEQGPPGSSGASGISSPSQQRASVHKPFTQSQVSSDKTLTHPAPRHVTEEEIHVLEVCLQRWRSEVETDTCALQRSISRLHRTIELMYSDKAMMKVPYRLHAVLVHEGQASAGHYWAYIYSPRHRCWMKCNDVSVARSSWEELVRDSFGGYRSASAYCLMYVDGRKPVHVEEEFDDETGQPLSGMEKLPEDLRAYVEQDNRRFEEELRQWDLLKERLVAAVRGTAAPVPGPCCPRDTDASRTVGTGPDQIPEGQETPSHVCDMVCLKADTERAVSLAEEAQEEGRPNSQLSALAMESVSLRSEPETLADLSLKMANTLPSVAERRVGDVTPDLPRGQHALEESLTPLCTGQSVLPLPELAVQGVVNRQVPINALIQGGVQRSSSSPLTSQSMDKSCALVPCNSQCVVEKPTASPPLAQPVEVSVSLPPDTHYVVELSGAVPPVTEPALGVSDDLPPDTELVIRELDAPPPDPEPIVDASEALASGSEPVIGVSDALASGSEPVIGVSDASAFDPQTAIGVSDASAFDPQTALAVCTEAVVERSPSASPDAQTVAELSRAPLPDAEAVGDVLLAPPTKLEPAAEPSVAPPPDVEEGSGAQNPPEQCTTKATSPDTDTSVTLSQETGDDDEAMMTPSMQGIVMAIGKARCVYDECGPEAAFFKAIKMEYVRLHHLACEDTPPEYDPRLHYIMVYLIQNQAPKKILERTLLTQFASHSLAFDERCKNIMKVAREKLSLIKPNEVNMEEYEVWHQDYQNFRETTIFLLIGLELFQQGSYIEALTYLIYSYQHNKELLTKGPYSGHDEELIAHYRRECLLRLSEHAADLFEYGEEPEVSEGLSIMSELVAPCLPLLLTDESEKDTAAVEVMRNHWCSYLGKEMEPKLQGMLTDFLPKLLDCSMETERFSNPPHLPSWSTLELCMRFSRVMTSLS